MGGENLTGINSKNVDNLGNWDFFGFFFSGTRSFTHFFHPSINSPKFVLFPRLAMTWRPICAIPPKTL
jgi:hypothetical protein